MQVELDPKRIFQLLVRIEVAVSPEIVYFINVGRYNQRWYN